MPDYANSARSVLEGLTFNNAAEMEAFIRAVARGNPGMYRQLKQQLDADYAKWSEENPKASLTGEFAGALLPGIVGAFLPGGQAATASAAGRGAALLPRLGTAARAMAEPVTLAAERVAPGLMAKRGVPTALAIADELGTGIVQSVGNADTLEDAPERIMAELPENVAFSLGVRGVTAGGKPLVRGGKKAVQKGLSVMRRAPRIEPPASLRAPDRSPARMYSGALRSLFGVQ
jgi:hypothetical protein